MLGLSDFLLAGVLPGVVALVVRGGLLRCAVGDRFAWPAAITLSFVAGQIGLAAQSGATGLGSWLAKLPDAASLAVAPREASHWLPAGALLAAAVGVLASGGRGQRIAAFVVGGLLALATPVRLLWGSVYLTADWSQAEAAVKLASLGVALLAIGFAVSRAPSEDDGARTGTLRGALLAAVAFGLAVVLATSGSLSYARMAGVVVAAVVGATLGAVGRRPAAALGGGVAAAGPVVTLLAGGLLVLGFFYAEVAALNAALVSVALAAAGLATGWRGGQAWRVAALGTVVCLAAIGFAAGGSAVAFQKAIDAEPANPYSDWRPN